MADVEVRSGRQDSKSISGNSRGWWSRVLELSAVMLIGGALSSCSSPPPVSESDKVPAASPAPPPSPFAQFGGRACEVSGLTGFYPAENWGSWSSQDPSEIALKSPLNGTVKMEFLAYAIEPHELKLTLGDVSKTVALTSAPKKFNLEFNLSTPVQKIVLSGIKPHSTKSDARLMAVGFVHVDCTATGN